MITLRDIKKINYQAILLFLSIAISFWYPEISLLMIATSIIYYLLKNSKHLDCIYLEYNRIYLLSLFILFLYELFSFFGLVYKDNSIYYLVIIVYCILLSIFCTYIINQNIQLYFKISRYINIYGTILASLTIIYYLFFINNTQKSGFTEFTNLRNMYMPFGKLSNDWVSVLFCFLPFSLYQYLSSCSIGWNRKKIVSLISVIIISLSILISFSRGAYLALFSFYLLFSFLILKFKIKKFKALFLKLTYIFITVGLFSCLIYTPLKDTVSVKSTTSHLRSIEGRKNIWKSSIDIFKEKPMFGIGSDKFAIYYNNFRDKGEDSVFTGRVSNSLIQLLLEKGIIGFVIYASIFFISLFNGIKKLKSVLDNHIKFLVVLNISFLISILIRDFTFSTIFDNPGILTILFFTFAFNTVIINDMETNELS